MNNVYIVATIRPWNITVFNDTIKDYPGEWHLIANPSELTLDVINKLRPKYIFFPHWSQIVPEEILGAAPCVCFHETDLPYGRGGSPLQNLIVRGHRETVITALLMTGELDAGPVYLKRPLSLEGLAEEIFIRAARVVADMIKTIIIENPEPVPQSGEATVFKRRKPAMSEIPLKFDRPEQVFDHIRMLDAEEYPRAYIEYGNFRLEFSRPALRVGAVEAEVKITPIKRGNDD